MLPKNKLGVLDIILIVAAFINKLKTRKELNTEEACNNVIYYQVRSIASLNMLWMYLYCICLPTFR